MTQTRVSYSSPPVAFGKEAGTATLAVPIGGEWHGIARWVGHTATWCVVAFFLGLFEALVAFFEGGYVGWWGGIAVFHLYALYLPIALVTGILLWLIEGVAAKVPGWSAVLMVIRFPKTLLSLSPRRVARMWARIIMGTLAFGMVGGVTWLALNHFAQPWSVAGAAGASAIGLLVVLPAIRTLLDFLCERLVPHFSWLSTPAFSLLLIAVGALAFAYAQREATLILVYTPLRLLWPLVAVVIWVVVGYMSSWLWRRLPRVPGVTVGASFCFFWVSAFSYGIPEESRIFIEESSVWGGRLLDIYRRFLDMDGDGFASLFGGGDCNDWNASIHPGAFDEEGDGIDADCFAGDGAPDVAPRGDGEMVPLPKRERPFNLLLITVDTLHRGHLGVNGYKRQTSPHIDAFAAQAVQFTEVMSQSSRSVLAIPSILVGVYPSEIARGDQYFWPEILQENITFPELLQAQGYKTEAYIGTNYFKRLHGLFQGFERVHQSNELRGPREEPVNLALEALERLRKENSPFLVWVHLMNVHEPYLSDGRPSLFGDDVAGRYDTEVFYADKEVGRLLKGLEELGLAEDTAVILASDHGEAFGAHHGIYFHASSLYEDQLAAMLFLRVPGVTPPGERNNCPVALLDIMPTILNLAGIRSPLPISGRSLLATLKECDAKRPIFAELIAEGPFPNDVRKVRRGDHTVIWDLRRGSFQAFDLSRDPGETTNIIRDPTARMLRDLLRAWVARNSRLENRTDEAYIARFRVKGIPPHATPVHLLYKDRLEIVACETPPKPLHPGEIFRITCYLRCIAPMKDEYKIVIWFTGPTPAPPDFHGIHIPINGRYPTTQWKRGELLRDVASVVVPLETPTPSEWLIHVAVDTPEGIRQEGISDGQVVSSKRIGILSIRPYEEREGR
ncbi:MAG: sulfatase-like hydrolase/transferase [Sandaracinaceae bacterium]|nr:sulfatase-like hydrolase/transferase [Sandaracinaceae bacterium]